MASLRALLRQILHLQESPHRTALAFAIGSAIAFCPFYGFHMALVGLCTWAFKLNFIALLAGALINNPWTIVPILGATYWTGAVLLDRSESPSFDWSELGFRAIYEQVMPYAVPFVVGGVVLSLIAALLSYPLALYLITKHRQNAAGRAQPLPPPDPLG
ncbi:MAG TPA: DUF2062 domain-containing protein [Nitrospira sp.]|nr:DUF2062 domain-containing protein [Nitrospira sp.]